MAVVDSNALTLLLVSYFVCYFSHCVCGKEIAFRPAFLIQFVLLMEIEPVASFHELFC